MHSGVEQNMVFVHLHEPPARADVSVGIQVCDPHKKIAAGGTKHSGRETAIKIGLILLKNEMRRFR
jgi:hypothetical protein